MYHLLICDDEIDILNALKIYLEADGYVVTSASNGLDAVKLCAVQTFDLVLLDIMMPQMDGIAVLSEIRKRSNVPVIFLTAKSEDADKVFGLNLGADDYVTKPFNPAELLARVRSHLRRYTQLGGSTHSESAISVGNITMDDAKKVITVDGDAVNLTPTEYEILKLLMQNPGKVFSPREIYSLVWNDIPLSSENTVAVHIRHLREKIEITPADPRYLKVVWGQGYKIQK